MINRKLLLLCTIILSVGLFHKVTSYTSAKVQNPLNFSINSSEDSLIAMPQELNLHVLKTISNTNKKILKDEIIPGKLNIEYITETKVETFVSENNFYIRNNMNESINVKSFINNRYNTGVNQGLRIQDNHGAIIPPGETIEIDILVDDSIENSSIDVIISAIWNNGSAEIYKGLNITVDTQTIDIEEILDLRTEKVENILNDEIDMDEIEDEIKTEENIIEGLTEEFKDNL